MLGRGFVSLSSMLFGIFDYTKNPDVKRGRFALYPRSKKFVKPSLLSEELFHFTRVYTANGWSVMYVHAYHLIG